jgi:hypothetical protein
VSTVVYVALVAGLPMLAIALAWLVGEWQWRRETRRVRRHRDGRRGMLP